MILTLIFVSTSCEKTNLNNMNVKTYLKLLKSGSYDFNDSNGLPNLPPFEPKDIPELLTYANDTYIVTKYPHNPISSYIGPDPRLGIFVLWTIESIRLSSPGIDHFWGRFPSQSPTLMFKGSVLTIDVETAHKTASKAYLNWWNSSADFEQIKNINPLENTDYGWR